jgi:hypothetical protein
VKAPDGMMADDERVKIGGREEERKRRKKRRGD